MRLLPMASLSLAAALTLGYSFHVSGEDTAGKTPTVEAPAAKTPTVQAPTGRASAGSSPSSSPRADDRDLSPRPDVQPPPPPPRKACYRLSLQDLTRPTDDSSPVPCSRRHNAQTIHVGTLDTVVGGHLVAVDSAAVQRQISTACPRRLAAFVGGDSARRALSRFEVVWFSPTLEQADRGANWFRCDLVAFATSDRLYQLPPPKRLRGVLDDAGGLATFGICGTGAPGTEGFERVICARRHSWRAIATVPISAGERFPGRAVVRRSGDETCRDIVQDLVGSVVRFQYGWEWPSRAQWRRGQHHGLCWAPD